ncbi:MAG: hypothetical protein SNJ56_01490 [Termitinemataceae bacterium]
MKSIQPGDSAPERSLSSLISFLSNKIGKDHKTSHSQQTVSRDVIPKNSVGFTQHLLSLASIADRLGLQNDSISLRAIALFQRFSLPLQKEVLVELIKTAHRGSTPANKTAILEALITTKSKGIKLSSTMHNKLVEFMEGTFTPLHKAGDSTQVARELPASNISENVLFYFMSSYEHFEQEYPFLGLYNQLKDRQQQRFVLLPFHFFLENLEFKGVLRLLFIDIAGKEEQLSSYFLSVHTEKRWYQFKYSAKDRRLTIQSNPPVEDQEMWIKSLSQVADTIYIDTSCITDDSSMDYFFDDNAADWITGSYTSVDLLG